MRLKSIPALLATSATVLAMAAAAMFALQGSTALAAQSHASKTTVVSARHTSLGTFLVGPNGHTLYLWAKDSKNKSACSGACAGVWPPLMASGTVKGTDGVKSSLLGSIARSGGRQVTYDGHPLYYYEVDQKAGQTTGQKSDSFGSPWYVVATSGSAIK